MLFRSIFTRDLGAQPPSLVTAAWVEGAFNPPESRSAAAQEAMRLSDELVYELAAADTILITTPIYNLSVPAALKAWIDQVVRVGRTFAFKDGAFAGLLSGKNAIVVVTSGSDLRPSGPGGAFNHLEPYLRAVLGFMGISAVRFVYAHSQNQADTQGGDAYREAQAELSTLAHPTS